MFINRRKLFNFSTVAADGWSSGNVLRKLVLETFCISLPTGVAWRSEVDVFRGVCLFVCQFVSLSVRTITSEWLYVEWWNWRSSRYVVQKPRPSWNVKVKGKRSGLSVIKTRTTAESTPFKMHSKAHAVGQMQQARTCDTIGIMMSQFKNILKVNSMHWFSRRQRAPSPSIAKFLLRDF